MDEKTPGDSQPPPRWRLDTIFPDLDSSEFDVELDAILECVHGTADRLERLRSDSELGAPLDGALLKAFESLTDLVNDLRGRIARVAAFVGARFASNTLDPRAGRRAAQLQGHESAFRAVFSNYQAWVATLDHEALLKRSQVARDHAHYLDRARVGAAHQLPSEVAGLVSELSSAGPGAWRRLHATLVGTLTAQLRARGSTAAETLPISSVRALASDPDRDVRRDAFDAELSAWKSTEFPLAVALNSIKKWEAATASARGWSDPLEASLFRNGVDHRTFEAMHTAVTERLSVLHRYLAAKARHLGQERLNWWDLLAPVGSVSQRWTWEEGCRIVLDAFARFAPRMAELAQRAMTDRWIDAEPREGKMDVGFCLDLPDGEARILFNFNETAGSVGVLAHELGHAYHNACRATRTPLQQETPMGLAETASTLAQSVVSEALVEATTGTDRLAALESDLQQTCQVIVDIRSRFDFERELFDRRRIGELSSAELCELMTNAQRSVYGDVLAEGALHPYMWAAKAHYYSGAYQNWPYTFGYLLALGLRAVLASDPSSFADRYERFLSMTGSTNVSALAAEVGLDVQDRAFWMRSLDLVEERVKDLERAVG